MPNFRRYPDEGFPYFVTTRLRAGNMLFAEPNFCNIALDNLAFLRSNLGHRVFAYMIMPDHVHLIVSPKEGQTISDLMHSFKLHTAREIGALLRAEGGIWQPRFYERTLRSSYSAETAMNYVHDNPVRAGIVNNPEDYVWSSYRACILGDPRPIETDTMEW